MQLLPRPGKSKGSPHPESQLEKAAEYTVGTSPDVVSLTSSIGDRVVVLIDASNLFYAAMQLDLEIDYKKLLHHLTRGRMLVRAYFYTGVDLQNQKQQGFLTWMRRNGYRVVAKELVQFPDGSKKADLNVEIAIDMMSLARHCDTIVLLSGNGDLAYAVDKITYCGVNVEVISLPSMLNQSLQDVADRFIDLTTLKPHIQKG